MREAKATCLKETGMDSGKSHFSFLLKYIFNNQFNRIIIFLNYFAGVLEQMKKTKTFPARDEKFDCFSACLMKKHGTVSTLIIIFFFLINAYSWWFNEKNSFE